MAGCRRFKLRSGPPEPHHHHDRRPGRACQRAAARPASRAFCPDPVRGAALVGRQQSAAVTRHVARDRASAGAVSRSGQSLSGEVIRLSYLPLVKQM